jgi:hypothetical protein
MIPHRANLTPRPIPTSRARDADFSRHDIKSRLKRGLV